MYSSNLEDLVKANAEMLQDKANATGLPLAAIEAMEHAASESLVGMLKEEHDCEPNHGIIVGLAVASDIAEIAERSGFISKRQADGFINSCMGSAAMLAKRLLGMTSSGEAVSDDDVAAVIGDFEKLLEEAATSAGVPAESTPEGEAPSDEKPSSDPPNGYL